jgi:hypothetical protein
VVAAAHRCLAVGTNGRTRACCSVVMEYTIHGIDLQESSNLALACHVRAKLGDELVSGSSCWLSPLPLMLAVSMFTR